MIISKQKLIDDFKKSTSGKKDKEAIELTEEQVAAVLNEDDNVLLSARAGSGKTSTIAAKIWYLVNIKKVKPSEILVLSFNGDTAVEVGNRINEYLSTPINLYPFCNATTFDSLSSPGLVSRGNRIFIDDDNTGPKIYTQLLDECLKEQGFLDNLKTWWFLRPELCNPDQTKHKFEALDGTRVKSYGELLIANYLFTHGISYEYEKDFTWQENKKDDKPYNPDFYVQLPTGGYVIWEHWGINPNLDVSSKKNIIGSQRIKNPKAYIREIKEKRNYWNGKKIRLIETSVVDMNIEDHKADEEYFNKIIENKLKDECGITNGELSEEELTIKICKAENSKKYIHKLLETYIQHAQRSRNYEDVKIIEDNGDSISCFLKLANEFYIKYAQLIEGGKYTDFFSLKKEATEKINNDGINGPCKIKIKNFRDTTRRIEISLKDIKWLMVDEYQDLSLPFYNIISALKNHNPSLKLFCVGDDWQAINGFAGSDLYYFKNFKDIFPEGKILHLLTNRRSRSKIVDISNTLMEADGGQGAKSIAEGGEIYSLFHDDFLRDEYYSNVYVIICLAMFAAFGTRGQRISFLTRNNYLGGMEKNTLKGQIIKKLPEKYKKLFKNNCLFQTVHKYKGKEADIVILLNSEEFNADHPDNKYFQIFRSNKDILAEEKRLFYVAQTRAKNKLVMLASNKEELSPFAQYCFA